MSIPARHPNLLQYWSIRYFLMISVSIAVMLIASLYIVSYSADNKQIRSLAAMARDIAAAAEDNGGILPENPPLQNMLEAMVKRHELTGRPILFILDRDGGIRQQHPSDPPDGIMEFKERLAEIMTGSAHVLDFKPKANGLSYRAAVEPMSTGYVVYLERKQTQLKKLFTSSTRFILLSMFLLLGWAVVYMMTQRLVKPLREVAAAAQQVVAGSYDVSIDKQYREAEIYELTHSFNEMARRMARLESLRSQLLTGITKELRTPVVSIHHMIQAVRNREVGAEEAQAYLEASFEESKRLHRMIEDLLEFNRFATSSIPVAQTSCELKEWLADTIDGWRADQPNLKLRVDLHVSPDRNNWRIWTDPVRLEQVLVNLLNNARDAMRGSGTVKVLLRCESQAIRIQVQDGGSGIAPEELDAVFEPFYRGKNNTTDRRGLGIGLPSGRLIARALGGDLVLSDGTPGQTTFTLTLPANHPAS
ncbi:HAMP domain-containing sensor histidine kinase [Cohnella fermenti]|uniref:histidine kinase n=1 Tax=Cohnella fermenti TaxID=2565925 RepID=A0A4S4BQD5_9BACL|nr:HAMP domain-containing sensor histidine kinase [Cohnella fermenti]THF77139.1 HAMP domain-containing histidine kinase [Cohnella fermenti]